MCRRASGRSLFNQQLWHQFQIKWCGCSLKGTNLALWDHGCVFLSSLRFLRLHRTCTWRCWNFTPETLSDRVDAGHLKRHASRNHIQEIPSSFSQNYSSSFISFSFKKTTIDDTRLPLKFRFIRKHKKSVTSLMNPLMHVSLLVTVHTSAPCGSGSERILLSAHPMPQAFNYLGQLCFWSQPLSVHLKTTRQL